MKLSFVLTAALCAFSAVALAQSGPTAGSPAGDSGNGWDPRRVGVRALGAYWGASGENIDTTSVNLNFSTPLIKPVGRGGWSIPFMLSYNSQMWRKDSGGTWELGQDVGYGMGWKLQAGSITPVWAGPSVISYYLYTDATGAEYSLSVNNGNVWTSLEGVYVSYDATANILHSNDGSFWVMGSQSSGGEQDAGTLYPTLIEDTNGNQIAILYEAGAGSGTTDTSARIESIADVRRSYLPSYTFNYNTDAIPHLISIVPGVAIPAEAWMFSYSGTTLTDPFAGASYGATALMSSVQPYYTGPPPSTFSYNSSAEMLQYTTPMGGSLSWTYTPFTYGSGITLREVNSRSMNDAAASLTNSWSLTHPSLDSSLPYHSYTYLTDSGASSEKAYQSAIILAGLVVPVGYTEENSSGSSVLLQKTFSWAQDAAGNSYVGTVASTLNPGTSYPASSHTVQTLDIYGNLTQQVVYDYGSATTPYLTYNFTYLNSSSYTSIYIRNRLTQATATNASGAVTLAANTYDGTTLGALLDPTQNNGSYPSYQPTPVYHDSAYGLSLTTRGNPTVSYEYGTVTNTAYLTTGLPYLIQDGGGLKVNVATDSSTANSLPSALTPNSNGNLANSMAYTSSYQLTSVTGPNGVTQSVEYDTSNRPTQSVSADGALTGYAYTYAPNTQTATISTTVSGTTTTQWKTTTFDGFGRTTRVQSGHDAVPVTNVDTKYAACGCSPLGKISATSMPYAPGAIVYWTTSFYDTSGRITSQIKPDFSTTYTGYWGNEVVVTDPAGKWKAYYNYVTGHSQYVTEPDPGGVSPFTYYAYNGAGQITFVAVQRAGVNQYREFAWSGSDLTSSTDPETGTTTYQYDGNHHVTLRTDAKGQQTKYTYDSYERLNEVQYYTPTGYLGAPVEVVGERVTYGYDSNPNNLYDYYVWGRLGSVSFSNGAFNYYYDYNQAGRVTANQFQADDGAGILVFNLQATYAWDNQGRMTSMTYPSGPTLNYQYDNVGRLSQITSPNYPTSTPGSTAAVTAAYNGASQLSTLNYGNGPEFTETRGYNSLMQLTTLTTTWPLGTVVNMQYNYNGGTNNGRVAQTVDGVLGETVNYTYDMWNRLTTASATSGSWGEQYTFDNFGNLTGKTPTAGSAPSMSLPSNLATNQPAAVSGSYDANGNPTPGSNYPGVPGYVWDIENRLATDQTNVSQPTAYTYDPWGRRVWKQTSVIGGPATGEAYFYGATGQKLETYNFTWGSSFSAGLSGINIYFGKKLLQSKGVWVAMDRQGSVRANSNGESMSYWPYGEERTSTANDREKFGTYTRDAVGQDYAMARYYSSSTGAFWTPDPGGIKTADPSNPGSWNRYAYTKGNPIGRFDPRGLEDCDPDDDDGCYCDDDPDGDGCTCLDDGSDCDSGGGPDPAPQKPKKPKKQPANPCANTNAVNFINAHLSDAQTLAASLSVPVAFVMAVSEAESTFGTSNITANTNNFFGQHAGAPSSTGTYTTSQGALVSSYLGLPDGYLSSGQDFVTSEINNASGITNASQFFTAISNKYGIGTPNYVSTMVDVEAMAATRIQDCIH